MAEQTVTSLAYPIKGQKKHPVVAATRCFVLARIALETVLSPKYSIAYANRICNIPSQHILCVIFNTTML